METVTCGWCDEQTPPGAVCAACGGDPAGPVIKPSGMQLVRDRRMAARQAMLDARRARVTETAPPPVEVPADPPGPADWSALAGASIDARLYAELPRPAVAPPGAAGVPAMPAALPVGGTGGPVPTGSRPGLVLAAVLAVIVAVVAVLVAGVTFFGSASPSKPPPAPAAAPKPWVTFNGPGFSAMFPVHPTASTGKDTTPAGDVSVETWDASTPQGKYTVAFERLPISPDAGEAPAYLDAVIQRGADDIGATVTSMQRVTVGPFQAEDATMSAPEGSVNMRVMIHGADVWYLLGIGASGPLPDYGRLLTSFDPALAGVPAPSPQGMT